MEENQFRTRADKIKASLTVDDIISLVNDGLGAGSYKYDNQGNVIFPTVCHNNPGEGSHKLYYYIDSQQFMCYTNCGSLDVFDLVQKAKHLESFGDAYRWVCRYFNIPSDTTGRKGFYLPEVELTADWDILNKINDYKEAQGESIESTILPEGLLDFYYRAYPYEWLREGITPEAMEKYGIRIDIANQKIVIPHRDINGALVGIRGRSYNPIDLDGGRKYMPEFIEDKIYNHPLGAYLYGLDKNKDTIARLKKVCVFESEKSVLLTEGYYPGNNFSVASCGSSGLSSMQLDALLSLGVQEIIFAYDRENDDNPESEQTLRYEAKLLRISQPLTAYFDVSVLFDYTPYVLLGPKDSPADRGKEVLETLMKNKIHIAGKSVEEVIKERRRKENGRKV